jgi:hypothetical protein
MSSYKIMGLDLAAANSGLCVIEAHYPNYHFSVVVEEALNHPMADFRNRIDAANYAMFVAKEQAVDAVAIEDYARRFGNTNTSGYEHAEIGGMVRKLFYEAGIPIYIIPPTSMRSFMEVPPKSPKDFLEDQALKRLGFASKASTKKKRSDITDAFIHAHIGSLLHIIRNQTLVYDLTTAENRILYGDNKIIGLKDRDGIYYGEEE